MEERDGKKYIFEETLGAAVQVGGGWGGVGGGRPVGKCGGGGGRLRPLARLVLNDG